MNVGQGGLVSVPFLTDAINIEYTLVGGIRKVGGTSKFNSTVLSSGAQVYGLFDYWSYASGSPVKKVIVHVGTTVLAADADGVFDVTIESSLTDAAVPSYALFDDDLIFMSDSSDVPRFTTGSGTASTLGTNTPNGAFGVMHKNRFFMAGVDADPSHLFYSRPLPDGPKGDWDNANAGKFLIDPGDGDRITGLVSYKNELWIFKGPNSGSIHRLSGSSPTSAAGTNTSVGTGAFSLSLFIRGVGAVNHNSIFKFNDDIGFVWSDGSVRSLQATAAFGDFKEASLSLPINGYLQDRINHTSLKRAWAKTVVSRGCVFITLPLDASTENNILLCMDTRFIPTEGIPRWSSIDLVECASLAVMVDTSDKNTLKLYSGGNDGFVREMNFITRRIDTSVLTYEANATLPYLHYNTPMLVKTLEAASLSIEPKGNYSIEFGYTVDRGIRRTAEAPQVAFGAFADVPIQDVDGEFSSIAFDVRQGGNSQDYAIHSISAKFSVTGNTLEPV